MQTWLLHVQVTTYELRVLRLNSLEIALQPIPGYIHREPKKDTKLLAITSPTSDFQIFFTSGLGSKFATNSRLNIPPRFKHVATLLCEI